MKWNVLLYCILTAFCFGIWPIIMKNSGLKPGIGAFILTAITLMIVFVPFINEMKIGAGQNLTSKALKLGLLVGLLNGLGIIFFQKAIVAAEDMSKSYIIILVSELPIVAISSIILLNEPFTIKKIAGLITAAITILLLA